MVAFMIEFGSLLGVLPVLALSLPVIVPIVNRRAARRQARSAIQLVELGRGDAVQRLKIDLGALRDRLRANEADLAVKGAVAREAERALARKESELARLTSAFDERSVLADWQKAEIAALTMQVQALNDLLTQVGEETKAVQGRLDAAVHALSEKQSELARLATALNERSELADSRERQIAALTAQIEVLNGRLTLLDEETRAVEERHIAAVDSQKVENAALRMQLRAVNERLVQAGKEARALEECCDVKLAEQSRLLNESEAELAHLRREIEIARKAEDDLRVAVIEIDGRANAAIQNLNTEKAQLQGALERANGERARFVHELAGMKRRQAVEFRPAEPLHNATPSECINDIAAENGAPRGLRSRIA
jgi:chromosome segregation ATPase